MVPSASLKTGGSASMATKTKIKKKKVSSKKKEKRLESPLEVITAFHEGMESDKSLYKDKKKPKVRTVKTYFEGRIAGVISTQCATLDAAIGIGGVPASRVVILHGKEGSGKTTAALHIVAEAQRRGGLGYYIDKERKLDEKYASKIIDPKACFLSCPKTLEDVVKEIKAGIRRARDIRRRASFPVPIVIVVDSLNACKAFETIETETGKKRYPAEARIWSEELPDIADELAEEFVTLVFISQVRKKMNVMYGSDEELAGGNAPRFAASLIIYFNRIGFEKDPKKSKTASIVEAECRKNQISPPHKKAKFGIFYNHGIYFEHSLVIQLESMGLIKKKGKQYKIGKLELGESRLKAANKIRSSEKIKSRLMDIFYKKMGWERE